MSRRIRVPSYMWAVLIGASVVPLASGRAAGQEPVASHRDIGRSVQSADALARSLGEMCEVQEELKGIRIDDCRVADGRLRLRGLYDNPGQLMELRRRAAELVKMRPKLREMVAKRITVDEMRPFPIRRKWLVRLQGDLSRLKSVDPQFDEFCHQTRLRDAYFSSSGGLVLVAESIGAPTHSRGLQSIRFSDRMIIECEELLRSYYEDSEEFERLELFRGMVDVHFVGNPFEFLNKELLVARKFDGVHLSRIVFDEAGALDLQGVVDSVSQRALLSDWVKTILGRRKGWKTLADGPIATSRMRVYPSRAVMAVVQRNWSTAQQSLLERSRLCRLWYGQSGHLAADVLVMGKSVDAKATSALLKASIRKQLQLFEKKWGKMVLGKVRVIAAPNLHKLVQPLISSTEKLDGVCLENVEFNAEGDLVLSGLWNAAQEVEVRAVAAKELRRVGGLIAESEMRLVSRGTFAVGEFRKDLQLRFSRHKDLRLRQSRLLRAWFNMDGDLQCSVLSLKPASGIDRAVGDEDRLESVLSEACRLVLAGKGDDGEVKFREPRPLSPPEVRRVANPTLAFQAEVGKTPTLDGTLIEGVEFNAEGDLVLSGLWSPTRVALVQRLAREVLGRWSSPILPEWVRLERRGEVGAGDILASVRSAVEGEKLEVWAERLHFSRTGDLTLSICAWGESGKTVARRLLRKALSADQQAMFGGRVDVSVMARGASGVARVQRVLSLGEESVGESVSAGEGSDVFVRKGFFDSTGRLVVELVVDRSEQKAALDKFFQGLEPSRGLLEGLPGTVVIGAFEVVSMHGMVDRLNFVQRRARRFAGVQIRSLYHDEDGRLQVTAEAVGQRPRDLETELRRLVIGDKEMSQRVARGFSIKSLRVGPRDPKRASSLLRKVIGVLRTRPRVTPSLASDLRLDLGLAALHSPEDSTSWFLHAMVDLSSGKPETVCDDLLHVAKLENRSQRVADRRYRNLERLQIRERHRMRYFLDEAKGMLRSMTSEKKIREKLVQKLARRIK